MCDDSTIYLQDGFNQTISYLKKLKINTHWKHDWEEHLIF